MAPLSLKLNRSVAWLAVAVVSGAIALAACGGGPKTEVLSPNARSIQGAIVSPRCVRCHSGSSGAGGVDLTDVESALTKKVQVGGAHDHKPLLLVPGCPEHSLFYLEVRDKKMPPASSGLAQVSPEELKTIETWIRGAGKPCGPDTSEPGTPDEPLDPPGP